MKKENLTHYGIVCSCFSPSVSQQPLLRMSRLHQSLLLSLSDKIRLLLFQSISESGATVVTNETLAPLPNEETTNPNR